MTKYQEYFQQMLALNKDKFEKFWEQVRLTFPKIDYVGVISS